LFHICTLCHKQVLNSCPCPFDSTPSFTQSFVALSSLAAPFIVPYLIFVLS